MTSDGDPFPHFSELLRKALGDLLTPEAKSLFAMFSENIVFEFPYAPPGGVKRLDGKAALVSYLSKIAELIVLETINLGRVIISPERNMAVLEFSCKGFNKQTGIPYDQDYVSILDLSDGRIIRYRDYWNPLVVLSALGTVNGATAIVTEEIDHVG